MMMVMTMIMQMTMMMMMMMTMLLLLRYFHRTTEFIDKAVNSGGLVVVNCVMGWSRYSKPTTYVKYL